MCRDSLQYVWQGKIHGQDSKKSVPQHGKGVCGGGGGGHCLHLERERKERCLQLCCAVFGNGFKVICRGVCYFSFLVHFLSFL